MGEVERAAMQSHVHLEFCKDTFDPMAKEHKEEIELHQRTVCFAAAPLGPFLVQRMGGYLGAFVGSVDASLRFPFPFED